MTQGAKPILEKLSNPPIMEVVCGFVFDPIEGLDPILAGTYWSERRPDFPKKELHPPVGDIPVMFERVPTLRTWLISADDAFVLQIQADRFYFNWRRKNADYPRFSDQAGVSEGILTRALREFQSFADFCLRSLAVAPRVSALDLSKIDHLYEGSHWSDLRDLARAVPWLSSFVSFARSETPDLAVRFSEGRSTGRLSVAIDSGVRVDKGKSTRVLKVESRMSNISSLDFRDGFEQANRELNEIFESLIPREERDERFHGK